MPANLESSPWTPERNELLRKLWIDGVSIREIAHQLGYKNGRNAVSGKAFRLGLGEHPTHAKQQVRRKATGFAAKPKPRRKFSTQFSNGSHVELPPSLPPEIPKQADFLGLTILEITDSQCKFIHGSEPGEFLCCGQPVDGESSWCEFHRNLCHYRITPERRTVHIA